MRYNPPVLYGLDLNAISQALAAILGESNPLVFNYARLATPRVPAVPAPATLCDNPSSPGAVIFLGPDWISGAALSEEHWLRVFQSLLMGEGELPRGFPSSGNWKDRSRSEFPDHPGRPYLFLSQCPSEAGRAALRAGFEFPGEPPEFEPTAETWVVTGEPRFADMVKHACRLGECDELFPLLIHGWPHASKDGTYIKQCLASGPSFVCEVDGNPVCWSDTHLTRTMGMIYTPEEFRGKGYASSLAAFQADRMLAEDGQATAHIWHSNAPSQKLLMKLGAAKLPGYFGWWRAYFPEARWYPSKKS